MRISTAGIELIKGFEAFRAKPYLCPAMVPTIGYGTTVYPSMVKVSMQDRPITESVATAYLKWDVEQRCQEIVKMIKVEVNQNQFDALVSFAYNVGIAALAGSTLLRKLNRGDQAAEIADEFLKWTKAGGKTSKGLERRRFSERALFLS